VCGGFTERLYSLAAMAMFDGFETTNLHPEGRKMHVRSKKELSNLCHEFGVVPAGDAPPPKTKFVDPN